MAAIRRPVLFAEKRFADLLEKHRRDNGYDNVTVKHTPATEEETKAWREGRRTKLAEIGALS